MKTLQWDVNELAAHILQFICCEADCRGYCPRTHLAHCRNAHKNQIDEAIHKLIDRGYLHMDGDGVVLATHNDTTRYTGFIKHPALTRVTFEFEMPVGANETQRDAAAFKALITSLNTAGIEIQLIETEF